MLSVLLLLVVTQVPCAPIDSSVVCHCKQGALSACEALRATDPQQAREIEGQLAQAVRLTEAARRQKAAQDTQASADAPEPPDCKGQNHHIISRPIAAQLDKHATLRGVYTARDPRFVAKAKDEESHCGYQSWHRDVDSEVVEWLKAERRATPKQFEKYLRELYRRKDLQERFPNGF